MSFTDDQSAGESGPGQPPPTSTDEGAVADSTPGPVEHPEVVRPGEEREQPNEAVEQPAKVMRIGSMIKLLLEEVRQSELDEQSRDRLREIYETSISELSGALSPDLRDELGRLAHPFADTATPSEAELRVAKAQLVGWLEGLFHGIQATLFAQQMAARQQLDEMRRRLPPGAPAAQRRSRNPPGHVPLARPRRVGRAWSPLTHRVERSSLGSVPPFQVRGHVGCRRWGSRGTLAEATGASTAPGHCWCSRSGRSWRSSARDWWLPVSTGSRSWRRSCSSRSSPRASWWDAVPAW